MTMRGRRQGLNPMVVAVMCIVVLVWLVQPAAGMSPSALPAAEPTLSAGGSGQGGGSARDCTRVSGIVVNWGFRNEPGVTLNLAGGGYEASQISGNEGQYEFRGLGQGYAVLRPVLPAAQAQSLHIYADQIAVPLTCGSPAVVNVGLYSGDQRPQAPARLTVAEAGTAEPGSTLTVTMTVENNLPTGISKVVVTDLLPDRLQYVDARAAKGQTSIQDGRMVAWNVGQLANGETASARLTVRVDPAATAGDLIAHRVSLLYAEAMADQVLTTIAVGQGLAGELSLPEAAPAIVENNVATATVAAPKTPAAQTAATPVAALKPGKPVSATIELTPSLPLVTNTVPLEGQPAKLPTTGAAPGGTAMPLIGLGLLAVAMAMRVLRRR
jgi:uncharacterized repeat protein (TIGR01451 family)